MAKDIELLTSDEQATVRGGIGLTALLAAKAPLDNPAFTGNPTVPDQTAGDNTGRIANTKFVQAAIAALIGDAPGMLDTLGEIATQLASDESAVAALTTALAGKQPLDADLTAIAALTTDAFGRGALEMATAAAFRAYIGAGVGGGDLVATNNLSDVANAATARANIGADVYAVGFFFTGTPTANEVLALHQAADAFTIPANFSTPNSRGSVGTVPTASFVIDVQRQVNATGAFSSIGTITVSTGGALTWATTSGAAKAIAANDVLKFVAPATPDATVANGVFTVRGNR